MILADSDADADSDPDDPATPAAVDAFIARWAAAGGGERANYQLFLTELCVLLGLPLPEPARADDRDNAYCFERRVLFRDPDGSARSGFIDLYRRACYVLEASWCCGSAGCNGTGAPTGRSIRRSRSCATLRTSRLLLACYWKNKVCFATP